MVGGCFSLLWRWGPEVTLQSPYLVVSVASASLVSSVVLLSKTSRPPASNVLLTFGWLEIVPAGNLKVLVSRLQTLVLGQPLLQLLLSRSIFRLQRLLRFHQKQGKLIILKLLKLPKIK